VTVLYFLHPYPLFLRELEATGLGFDLCDVLACGLLEGFLLGLLEGFLLGWLEGILLGWLEGILPEGFELGTTFELLGGFGLELAPRFEHALRYEPLEGWCLPPSTGGYSSRGSVIGVADLTRGNRLTGRARLDRLRAFS